MNNLKCKKQQIIHPELWLLQIQLKTDLLNMHYMLSLKQAQWQSRSVDTNEPWSQDAFCDVTIWKHQDNPSDAWAISGYNTGLL